MFSMFRPRNSQNGTPTHSFVEVNKPNNGATILKHFQAQKLPKCHSHAAARIPRRGEQAQQREYYFKALSDPETPKMVLLCRCSHSFVEVSRPNNGSAARSGPETPKKVLRRDEQAQQREFYFKHFQAQKLPKW